MKNITDYKDMKYDSETYAKLENGIYKIGENIVTSLCFQQEPKYEKGNDSTDISQYPLEDILDKYYVYISDLYEDKNALATKECYLEFCGTEIDNIRELRSIIGKHVYCKSIVDAGAEYVELIIE